MEIVVFGASGQVGRLVVRQALEQGHTVTAFARTPAKLAAAGVSDGHARLRVVQGDVRDARAVAEAVRGKDAVVSAVGMTKTSGGDVLAVTAQHVVAAMARHGVRRLVSLVGAGVADSHDRSSVGRFVMRGLMKLVVPKLLEDAERHAETLRTSDLDWTLVRPPRLTAGAPRGDYRAGYLQLGPREHIARADLAAFMLRLATEGGYEREAPMVSY